MLLGGISSSLRLADSACWCLRGQKPVILKGIKFLEKTEAYQWRNREGFPTHSEASGEKDYITLDFCQNKGGEDFLDLHRRQLKI